MVTAGITTISYSFVESNTYQLSDPLQVESAFGRGPSCLGRGICSITNDGSNSKAATSEFLGDILIDTKGRLIMKISRKEIPDAVIQEQFENNQMVIEEEFNLPEQLLSDLGITHELLTIPIGNYPVEITKNDVTVTFNLHSIKK